MSEPILTTPNPAGTGAPETTDEQYRRWIEDMRPYLRMGSSLWYSMEKADLLNHKDTIYRKYRLNDWFCEKVDALRATPGELINNVGFRVIEAAHTRLVETEGKSSLTGEEVQVFRTMAEKHRSAQPFFVNRTETAEADPNKVGKVLDILEGTDYEDVGQKATRQMVEANPPVQNKDESGTDSNVSA